MAFTVQTLISNECRVNIVLVQSSNIFDLILGHPSIHPCSRFSSKRKTTSTFLFFRTSQHLLQQLDPFQRPAHNFEPTKQNQGEGVWGCNNVSFIMVTSHWHVNWPLTVTDNNIDNTVSFVITSGHDLKWQLWIDFEHINFWKDTETCFLQRFWKFQTECECFWLPKQVSIRKRQQRSSEHNIIWCSLSEVVTQDTQALDHPLTTILQEPYILEILLAKFSA